MIRGKRQEQGLFRIPVPIWIALCFIGSTVFLALIFTGVLPVWLLFVYP